VEEEQVGLEAYMYLTYLKLQAERCDVLSRARTTEKRHEFERRNSSLKSGQAEAFWDKRTHVHAAAFHDFKLRVANFQVEFLKGSSC
jgi:hypothetical protein